MHLPRDLLDIVWDFAYFVRTKTHPATDLAYMLEIQNSVPAVFLRNSLPAAPIFDIKWEFLRDQEYSYSTLYIPNPYVLGNPYHPSDGICEYVTPWAFTMYRLFQLMRVKTVRETLRTYPAILLRKVNRHFNSGIHYWNNAFHHLWTKDVFIDRESYKPENTADEELIELVCSQLAQAGYFSHS